MALVQLLSGFVQRVAVDVRLHTPVVLRPVDESAHQPVGGALAAMVGCDVQAAQVGVGHGQPSGRGSMCVADEVADHSCFVAGDQYECVIAFDEPLEARTGLRAATR